MKRLGFAIAVFGALLGPAFAKDDEGTTRMLVRLGKVAECTNKASLLRPWCVATEWGTGKVEAPKGTLIGISVPLSLFSMGDKAVKDALLDKVGFVALAVTGDKVKLVNITPSDDKEGKMIAEAVGNLALQMKGKAPKAKVPKELASFLKSSKGEYPLAKGATEATWKGNKGANDTRLRKVGSYWVAIEHTSSDADKTMWVSILTDAWE